MGEGEGPRFQEDEFWGGFDLDAGGALFKEDEGLVGSKVRDGEEDVDVQGRDCGASV